ncbi:type VI secretion lipoprotein TssJ [Enterobacter asburiae]|uniref:type VI secretion lipoprotein TssJ n=1 Tax=Enterobacter asburiae TaxID=61645 RepID=UPI001FFF1DC3|nr:type VI secretion lipoprotein TssJ [Enterobacter asburiae]
MKPTVMHLLFISIIMVLTGCSLDVEQAASTEQQAVNEVKAPYAQAAITVNITATPDLNSLDDIANSCSLLIIQSQKLNPLNNILNNPAQLKSLFSGGSSEDEILKVDRYPVMPSQRISLHIDRTENTHYVAVVAGYYPFPKKQHMTIVRIPVTTTSKGFWNKKWYAEMENLAININLGSQSITQLTTTSYRWDSLPSKESTDQKSTNDKVIETGVK